MESTSNEVTCSAAMESVDREDEFMKGCSSFGSVVCIDVGGTEFSMLVSTLERYKESNLAKKSFIDACVQHTRDPQKYPIPFLDRDPELFQLVLGFLRTQTPNEEIVLPDDPKVLKRLRNEARFYQLSVLEDAINTVERGITSASSIAPTEHEIKPVLQVPMSTMDSLRYSKYVVLVFERVVIMNNDKPVAGYNVINGKQSNIETEGWFSSFELESLQNSFRVAISRLLEKHVELGYRVTNSTTNTAIVRGLVRSNTKPMDYHSIYTLTIVMER
mmetsp:Transcript_10199/g.18369  ORF Transcript_10199/g.18369 Transcript_10199/m.18369 type:complete len:274 (-) Transcript_10199:652-1473(-)